jgi:hypothetical protein
MFEDFESRINYFEQQIELRVQSVFNELDKFEDLFINQINFFQKKVLRKKNKKLCRMRIGKLFINRENFGIFYNEFDKISDLKTLVRFSDQNQVNCEKKIEKNLL